MPMASPSRKKRDGPPFLMDPLSRKKKQSPPLRFFHHIARKFGFFLPSFFNGMSWTHVIFMLVHMWKHAHLRSTGVSN